jgi:DNA-binding MarR family transcriptional regulator
MGKKTDPGTSIEHLLKSGAETSEILAGIACTNTALRLATRQLTNLYDEALEPTELKATQAAVLAQIEKLAGDHGPALQDLAQGLAIRISALTHALRPLVRDGLIELRKDDKDARTKRAVLTRSGKARLRKALVLWNAANRRVEGVLGPAAAATLRRLADEVASDKFLTDYKSRGRLLAPADDD